MPSRSELRQQANNAAIVKFKELISHHHVVHKTGLPYYYYQYEMDSSITDYEALMRYHQFAILATSYKEAMLINLMTRFIIDGHAGCLEGFIEDCEEEGKSDVQSLYKMITSSDDMLQYKDYKSNKLKWMKDNNFRKLDIERDIPCIMTMQICEQIINHDTDIINLNITDKLITMFDKYFKDQDIVVYPETLSKVVDVKVGSIRPMYKDLKEWCADPNNVYIGRRGVVFIDGERYPKVDSPWHNPFKIGKDGDRREVLKKYKEYIIKKLPDMDIDSIRNKTLGCWCSPEPCHGDVLLELLELN